MSRLLDIRNLAVSYGAVHALKQVSLHVDTNEIVTIIGGNGGQEHHDARPVGY